MLGNPEKRLQVSQPAFAFFQVWFNDVAGVALAGVAGVSFCEFVSDELNVLSDNALLMKPGSQRIGLSRLDARGAMIGSEDAVDNSDIQAALNQSSSPAGTNLGDLFKKALEKKQK